VSGCLNPHCWCKPNITDTSDGAGPAYRPTGIPGVNRLYTAFQGPGDAPGTYDGGRVSGYVFDLLDHPAVKNHGQGVSTDDLASFIEALGSQAQYRIRNTGHDQYAEGEGQQFERMTPVQLAEWMLEEAADVINYQAMSAIKVLAVVRAMKGE